jgi:hypothetical protein
MTWINSTKIFHLWPAPGSASLPGISLAAFSSCWISSSHTLMCLALIPVAPPARPFFNTLTTFRNSESVGTSLEISKCGKSNGRASLMGGALGFNSTCSAICLTMVSGHVGRGWSSADLVGETPVCGKLPPLLAPPPRTTETNSCAATAHTMKNVAPK